MKQCSVCKEMKSLDEFYVDKKRQLRIGRCNTCRAAAGKLYHAANRESVRANQLRYNEEHREELAAAKKRYAETHRYETKHYHRGWAARNQDKLRAARDRFYARNPTYRGGHSAARYADPINRATQLSRQRQRWIELKAIVFDHYGGFICACCGERGVRFLTLDHINNDGAAHRKQLDDDKRSTRKMYQWLVEHDFPVGFQILCMNCNWGKSQNGGVCPHQDPEGSTIRSKDRTVEVSTSATGSARHPWPCYAGVDEDMIYSVQ